MKKTISIYVLTLIALIFSGEVYAEKFKGDNQASRGNARVARTSAAGCLPSKASTELNLNNVRARINAGGDMWWDLQGIAQYEIPKGSTKTAMFSASLWLGGTDVNGQLKGAFQRYRGRGNDYWPGPLTTDGKASIEPDVCAEYDKHFVVTREEVDNFILKYNNPEYPDYIVPEIIKNWPANGDVSRGQSQWLAPFVDRNGNGVYEWEQGEYPFYDIENRLCKPVKDANGNYYYAETQEGGILADQVLKGDQTIWWIFNDNGNIHTESDGNAIGVEIRAQAFSFSTNDEINNMTFYTYEIINRSTFRLTNTYFSQWVDTDLGYAFDDYVGCDVQRGLGYCYNGKEIDGLGKQDHYGEQPPAIGVDFFQGPYMDKDGIDNPKFDTNGVQICDESINGVNFGDSIVDNERFGMRKFVYHNNQDANNAKTDPTYAFEYYQYLLGIWKDATRMTYGGTAHKGTGPECDFMFPDETDICDWGTGGIAPTVKKWTEEEPDGPGSQANPVGDRRFMQSAGEFTLESGAINYITVGIPFARAVSGGPFASVELLRQVDDKAQALFDNCFKVLDGPDAPELVAQEMDRSIILYLKNLESSNNANEDYMEEDVTISALNNDTTYLDPYYRFQGYQIFQFANEEVSLADVGNPDLVRLVFQCDLKDSVENLTNYTYNDDLGGNVPELMVEASNNGIVHSFKVTRDLFATGDNQLINNKKYYFVAIAYAENNYLQYSQDPADINGLYGQKEPYLAGRKSAVGPIKVHTLIPHLIEPEAIDVNSEYGEGPKITRLDGQGNGGMDLELTEETKARILTENQVERIEYINGRGPINVKVIDPLSVVAADYELRFIPEGDVDTASWVLYKNGELLDSSEATIVLGNEQLFLEDGISIAIEQTKEPGNKSLKWNPDLQIPKYQEVVDIDETNGFISGEIIFEDSSYMWLAGIGDNDNYPDIAAETPNPANWIRSGTNEEESNQYRNDYEPGITAGVPDWLDPNEVYEKVIYGTWAPYRLASRYENGPAYPFLHNRSKFIVNSVDIVFTSDQSLWSRCPVIETGDVKAAAEGDAMKFYLRASQSIDKDGEYATPGSGSDMSNQEASNFIAENGMGWFPGYAIDVETGERLNIMYGESSWLVAENGRDMQFNPTHKYATSTGEFLMGGKHFLYIFRHSDQTGGCPAYDHGAWLYNKLNASVVSPSTLRNIHQDIMWTSIPMAKDGYEWLQNDATVRLRVNHAYKKNVWNEENSAKASTHYNNDYPAYAFNTGNIAAVADDAETAESALDLIRVVPNPYYAFSSYETDQLDNRVRITNLPEVCTVSIYSTNGTLVRRYKKDETNTFLDWDLKNHASIPIASGVYYIHVDAPGIGEKVIKWFGVIRTVDLNAF